MFVVFPLIAALLLILIFQVSEHSWRRAVLDAAIIWGVLVAGLTEVLSSFQALTWGWIGGLWGCIVIGLAFLLWSRLRHGTLGQPLPTLHSPFLTGLLAGIAIIIGTTGFIALVAPPNTWDSLTYHMSRVMHWVQDRSVEHYPTHIQRQLHHTPWTEFAILHLQLLSGNDRFANSVQWFAMLGSVAGVSLIAKQLGADVRGQIFSAVIAATIPMGILQASSTQTDWALSFWLICCVHYGLRLIQTGIGGSLDQNVFGVAAGLGLALLTKPTGYIYALPFMLWFLVVVFRSGARKAWPAILVCVAVTLSLNAGHYGRNIGLYGSPMGPMEADLPKGRYTNDAVTFSLFASNLLRNLALHAQTPSAALNASMEKGVRLVHAELGVSVDDPRTTFSESRFRLLPPLYDEDGDGNLLHLALILAAMLLILGFKPLRKTIGALPYMLSLAAAFVLFCLLLKWQPYNSRLHLPWFVLWSPLIGLCLAWNPRHRLVGVVLVLALAASTPWLLFNNHRPLIGHSSLFTANRTSLYFVMQPDSEGLFKQTSQEIDLIHCSSVGLDSGGNAPEYLLWITLQQTRTNARIEHVSVKNPSAFLFAREPFRSFVPCRTIVLEESPINY